MKLPEISSLFKDAIALLRKLIATPSFSREEDQTANIIEEFFNQRLIAVERLGNNVFVRNKYYHSGKPTILLNSHHDTVKPNSGYTRDPFDPSIEGEQLFGLGSNDAGGCLVALIAAFLHFCERKDLKYNIVFAASAEEEISGHNGITALLPAIGAIDFAIVGEPTLLKMAVAEKGLMVLDCVANGMAGHAARDEGENAIYKAIKDIEWFRTFSFTKKSDLLGPVKMNVTLINAGTQHNVVPASCSFVVDIRTTDCYTHEEILEIISGAVSATVTPRSIRLRSTSIPIQHPLVQAGLALGLEPFGSSTLSDKALMPFPALKMGPGDSARSHMADEYIYCTEIQQGIATYIQLLNAVL